VAQKLGKMPMNGKKEIRNDQTMQIYPSRQLKIIHKWTHRQTINSRNYNITDLYCRNCTSKRHRYYATPI